MTETPPGWEDLPLTPVHAAYLEAHAILPHVARAAGVRSVATMADLPDGSPDWSRLLPGLLYRWEFHGVVEYQLATDDRDANQDCKYVFRKGAGSVIHEALAPADDALILVVEGTKQHLAAASYAPEGTGVIGVAGCNNWRGLDWTFLDGRDVVVIFDGDVTTNRDVYDAATAFGDALQVAGAASVRWARVPL